MINYDKPNNLIYTYSGVVPGAAFKSLGASPYVISPTIFGEYIQLLKFTITLAIRSGFGAPPNFILSVSNNFANQTLGAAEINYLQNEPAGVIWEINPIVPTGGTIWNNAFIYDKGYSPTALQLIADVNDANREMADAPFTLLYTKYTI